MEQLTRNVPFFVVLASAIFLVFHDHWIAGGFLLLVSGQLARVD